MQACHSAVNGIYFLVQKSLQASALTESITEGALTRCQEASSGPWRVGVLFSQSGVMAVIEETQLRATLFAIDEINQSGGVNGVELVPTVYDPQSDARTYALCAKRLMVEDGITMIF